MVKSDMFCLPQHIESYSGQVFAELAREEQLKGLRREEFVERAEHGMASQAAVVRAARARQEITVEQVAIRSGRSPSEFAAFEAGTLELEADQLRDVLLVLGEELITGAGWLSTVSDLYLAGRATRHN